MFHVGHVGSHGDLELAGLYIPSPGFCGGFWALDDQYAGLDFQYYHRDGYLQPGSSVWDNTRSIGHDTGLN